MSNLINWQHQSGEKYDKRLFCQTICNDCAFHILVEGAIKCIHPEEFDTDCSRIIFCNSFQPAQEIDSPCVTFGDQTK